MQSRHPVKVYYCGTTTCEVEVRSELAKLGLVQSVEFEVVPCSGRIDPRYILKAFESGAQSVYIIGCAKGECLLMEGNLRATRRTEYAGRLLAEVGMNPDSVQIFLQTKEGESAAARIARAIASASAVHAPRESHQGVTA